MSDGPKPSEVRSVHGIGNAPMLLACFAFAAGILWSRFVWTPPRYLLPVTFLCALAASFLLYRRYWRFALLGIVATFVLLGALAWQGATSVLKPDRLRTYANNQEVGLTGIVRNDAVLAPAMYGGLKESIDLEVELITTERRAEPIAGAARITLYTNSTSERDEQDDTDANSPPAQSLRAGQRLRLIAKLNVPTNYGNPGAFDYRHYLERQGIYVSGGGKLENVVVLDEDVSSNWDRWRTRFRRVVSSRIHAMWPPDRAAVLDAMLLGDSSGIGRDVRNDFQRSGTYHILVVSGFNVGILAFATLWLLRRLRVGDGLATVITLLLAAAYTYVADVGPPVVRATIMLGIYLLTRWLYRDRAALNAVSTAALALLLWDPESLFDPSFQLTFLSVLAIAGIVLPIVEMTSGPYHRGLTQLSVVGFDSALPPKVAQFRLDLRLLISRIARLIGRRFAYRFVGTAAALGLGLFETLLVSGVMQFALVLPMTWYFHRATLSALPANAMVVPLTALMLPISIVALCLGAIWSRLAVPAKLLTDWLLAFITGTVRLFGTQVDDIRIPTPTLAAAIASAFGLGICIYLFRRRNRLASRLAIVILLLSAGFVMADRSNAARAAHSNLQIISIDVGQGDSFLVITPEGKTLLLDSGGMLNGEHASFDVGEDVVAPFLWSVGLSELDAVAVSHTHADHAGGMPAIIRDFRPRELWLPPGAAARERTLLLHAASDVGAKPIMRTAGQTFAWGGAIFEILNPPADADFGTRVKDDDALVLRVTYQGTSALFCADIGKKGEGRVIAKNPHADLLKIAHHGSANATSDEFLRAVHPSYAMISVGRRNSFGHPRPQTLVKLAAAHIRTYRTDLFGATLFELDRNGVRARPLALSVPR